MRKTLITGALAVCGIAFMIMGIMRGEMDTIFVKATRICLECIGIG